MRNLNNNLYMEGVEMAETKKTIFDSKDSKALKEFDDAGNLIHFKTAGGYEKWWDRDENGRVIHYHDSTGFEAWMDKDENGRLHYRDNEGYEYGGNIISME